MISTRRGPKRSITIPARRKDRIVGREAIPQARPACTTLRFSSSVMAGSSTDRLMPGMATTRALVNPPRIRMNHLDLWLGFMGCW